MKSITILFLLLSAFAVAQDAGNAETCKQSLHGFWREKDAEQAIALFKQLQVAVHKDDRKAVAEMMFYPLMISGEYRIHNRTAFLRHYDQILDRDVRDAIARQVPECLEGNWQGFRTELGEVWIDGLNNGPMKVKAINTDSWPKKESQNGAGQ